VLLLLLLLLLKFSFSNVDLWSLSLFAISDFRAPPGL